MAGMFQNLADSLVSGSAGKADPTALFRILRWQSASSVWKEHPFFGIGFGGPIVSSDLIITGETQGLFNQGMPHNTYLFLLARTGLLGFGLVIFGISLNIRRMAWRAWQTKGPDELAAANVLIAMAGFASFVFFFERPCIMPLSG
jgi:O-antigen ligase